MALTIKTQRTYHDYESELGSKPVKASSTIYEGSAVGLTAGYARALVAGDLFAGFARQGIVGTSVDGAVHVKLQRRGLVQLAITSLAVTDVGKMVYASDDGTFTLTQSTNTSIGPVERWISTGLGVISFDAIKGGGGSGSVGGSSIALLTGGTNITAATANGVLADSSATNPTEGQFNELAKELMVKINEIISALR